MPLTDSTTGNALWSVESIAILVPWRAAWPHA
jgi:hypothetical protein